MAEAMPEHPDRENKVFRDEEESVHGPTLACLPEPNAGKGFEQRGVRWWLAAIAQAESNRLFALSGTPRCSLAALRLHLHHDAGGRQGEKGTAKKTSSVPGLCPMAPIGRPPIHAAAASTSPLGDRLQHRAPRPLHVHSILLPPNSSN
ncbi:hypothetical protein BP5796_07273 [Coleophoma crateriformis]|uniref:Uncharacterized protein n=1 Tax=Coleophoma crateriformis TaxID=565419 RepID=A0A3D8RJ10_9HELO|nr:hypothetical protein BP5796_07273 [Coleophoma crateriformis]